MTPRLSWTALAGLIVALFPCPARSEPPAADAIRYAAAENLRQQGYYPAAAVAYAQFLDDFPHSAHRNEALQRLFDIANYWLEDTRQEMVQWREVRDGKRWFVWPRLLHFDRTRPFLAEEGHALAALNRVRNGDPLGPHAERALFLMGAVKFFREAYPEAAYYFTELIDIHPQSVFAPQAVELAIISKQAQCFDDGADEDALIAEIQKLLAVARRYPELTVRKQDFLERQKLMIRVRQERKERSKAP